MVWSLLALALAPWLSVHAAPRWDDPHWLKLLHYRKQITGGYLSEADGKEFFLSSGGKSSPRDELAALLKALHVRETDEFQDVFCRFPARIRWLRKTGHAIPPDGPDCRELKDFRERVSATSLHVVFSSYFLSNPVSSFGHTFLRLGKSAGNELLDTGVSYAAEPGDAGVFAYVFHGLTGGFPGEFRAVPYYTKVHDYNDAEKRDLWSYELDFNQEEIDFVVDHLWELDRNHFDYFFFTENCSYHVLTLLEAAKPGLDLRRHMPAWYVIPADTLKAIAEEGLIKAVSFRPSPDRVSQHLTKMFREDDLWMVPRVVKEPALAREFPQTRAAAILDAALLQFEMEQEKRLLEQDPHTLKLQRELLLARAKVPVRSPPQNYGYMLASAPHLGHDSRRLRIGGQRRGGTTWSTLGIRGANHDVLDHETSYLPKTSLELLEFTARSDGKRLEVESFTVLNTLNLRDIAAPGVPVSWKARLGGWRDTFKSKERQKHGLAMGLGLAQSVGPLTGYILPTVEVAHVSLPTPGFRPSSGADLGLLLGISSGLKIHSLYGFRDAKWDEPILQNELRLSNREIGVGVGNTYYRRSKQHELHLSALKYF